MARVQGTNPTTRALISKRVQKGRGNLLLSHNINNQYKVGVASNLERKTKNIYMIYFKISPQGNLIF